jgi:1-acyl-sn-glycerol-3-phosphate acyltransferase
MRRKNYMADNTYSWTYADLIRTIVSRILLFLIILICFIPGFIFLYIVPQKYRYDSKLYYWFEYVFYWMLLKATFLKINYVGLEHVPHHEPAIIAPNHQSSLDIPLVGAMIKTYPHIWLATITLLDSPVLRFIVPKATVMVDMSTPLKGMRTLIQAIQMINGTQRHFIDGSIHDFYAGFVILAKKTGRPVVPVRIFNANKVYPPKRFIMRNQPITVVVGKPMRMHEDETDEAFKERVHRWFVEQKEP